MEKSKCKNEIHNEFDTPKLPKEFIKLELLFRKSIEFIQKTVYPHIIPGFSNDAEMVAEYRKLINYYKKVFTSKFIKGLYSNIKWPLVEPRRYFGENKKNARDAMVCFVQSIFGLPRFAMQEADFEPELCRIIIKNYFIDNPYYKEFYKVHDDIMNVLNWYDYECKMYLKSQSSEVDSMRLNNIQKSKTIEGNVGEISKPNDLYSLADIARKYQVSKVNLQRMVKDGRLKSHRPDGPKNGKHMISESDIAGNFLLRLNQKK